MQEKIARKEREFKARRADILMQAEKIFAAKGFYNVTMAEIANAAGFSTGSLYQYFKGKEDLYCIMFSEKLDLMYEQIMEKVQAPSGILEKIEMVVDANFQFVEDNADFFRLFIQDENIALSEIDTSLRQKMIDGYSRQLTFLENEFENGIKNGYLRPLPARDMAGALLGLIRSLAFDAMLFPKKASLSSLKSFILEIFLRGVQQNEK